MELKKLHMGTMSYSLDTMDEIMSHLASAFEDQEPGKWPKHTHTPTLCKAERIYEKTI